MIKFFQHVILSWRWFSLILRTYMCDKFIRIGSLVLYIRRHCYSSFRYYHRHASFTAQGKKDGDAFTWLNCTNKLHLGETPFSLLWFVYLQAEPQVILWEVRFILCVHATPSFTWHISSRIRDRSCPGKGKDKAGKSYSSLLVLHTSNCFFLE